MSDELKRLAADAGLERALAEHPDTVQKALAAARKLNSDMPREFALSDEPAHTFRLVPASKP